MCWGATPYAATPGEEADVPGQANRWTAAEVPAQEGRTVVITGANTGVGFETARFLASRGAEVVLACRDPQRAEQAKKRIESQAPGARLDTVTLDLASLASVRSAAAELRSRYARIDVLINNAGVMWAPKGRTADGF